MPFLLVLFFDRVTYNHYVATALTGALIIASYYSGYMDSIYVGLLDVASLIGGFIVAKNKREQRE